MTKVERSIVKLREKPISNGYVSLYLDITPPGKKRVKEYLSIKYRKKAKDQLERNDNKEKIALAQRIRAKRESEILHGQHGYADPKNKKINILKFIEHYIDNYQQKDVRMMKAVLRVFKSFCPEDDLKAKELDEKLVKDFREYLIKKFNGETPSSYFDRFKKFLNILVEKGILNSSPAKGIRITVPKDDIKKEILIEDEIIKLASTHYPNENTIIKKAFIFSLFTGIDFDTTITLEFKNIVDGQLKIIRKKVKESSSTPTLLIPLNKTCLGIINSFETKEGKIFKLPTHTTCLKHLKKWKNAAGIEKHLTWHCARHSFITNVLINGDDVGTVKSLSGHRTLEHLQKYIHYVDERKKNAVEKFPVLEIG